MSIFGRASCCYLNNFIENYSRILVHTFYTSSCKQSHPPQPEKVNQEHVDIMNKVTIPTTGKIFVTNPTEAKVLRAANSFKTNSVFYDDVVSKFVNCMMKGGKKVVSQRVLNDTFHNLKCKQLEKYHKADNDEKLLIELNPLSIFHKAIQNSMPVLGTQTMKKKGKNFQVPYPLPESRRQFLAIRWIITTARLQPGNSKPMYEKLSKVLTEAYNNEGSVVQKKRDFHKKAETNRAHAHYRWW